jgi:hypothetical protein
MAVGLALFLMTGSFTLAKTGRDALYLQDTGIYHIEWRNQDFDFSSITSCFDPNLHHWSARAAAGAPAVGLEVSFGRPLDGDKEPLARPEPVAISLGNGMTFKIAGRIDRINEVGAATFEVLDYKTGGCWRDSWKGVFAGGRRLQHALYGLANPRLRPFESNVSRSI